MKGISKLNAFKAAKTWLYIAEKHAPKCQYCQDQFKLIQTCAFIKALPNGALREANEHIPNCDRCSKAMQNMINCGAKKK